MMNLHDFVKTDEAQLILDVFVDVRQFQHGDIFVAHHMHGDERADLQAEDGRDRFQIRDHASRAFFDKNVFDEPQCFRRLRQIIRTQVEYKVGADFLYEHS